MALALIAMAIFGLPIASFGIPLALCLQLWLAKRNKKRFGEVNASKTTKLKAAAAGILIAGISLITVLTDIFENGPEQRLPIYLTPLAALIIIVADNLLIRRKSNILTPLHWLPAAICVAGTLTPLFVNTMNADLLRSINMSDLPYSGNYWGAFIAYGTLGTSLLIIALLDHRDQTVTSKAASHVG